MSPAWDSFAVMVGGASGALTGLLFVAVSLNRDQITRDASLRSNAAQTLLLLIIPLLLCIIILIPRQRAWALGLEFITAASATLATLLRARFRAEGTERSRLADLVDRRETSLLITAFITTAGVTSWAGHGGGLYWIVPAITLALIAGVLNAWLFLTIDADADGAG